MSDSAWIVPAPTAAFSELVLVRPRLVPESAISAEERQDAAGFRGARREGFIAGRAALRRALERLGHEVAVRRGDGGEPLLPAGVAASLSHKEGLAVALAEHAPAGHTLGLDLELVQPLRVDISAKILTPRELEALPAEAELRMRRVRLAFSLKEAIYKAIYPKVRRYVAFGEVELDFAGPVPRASGTIHGATDVVATDLELDYREFHVAEVGGVVVCVCRQRG